MKHQKLIAGIQKAGFWLKRHGAEHDIYTNGHISVTVPRHKDVNENTAKAILKTVGK